MAIRILTLIILGSLFAPAQAPQHTRALALQNAPLLEVIDRLARELKINYILDPRVKSGVINTYGESQDIDTKDLLDLILRINGAGLTVADDNKFRIAPAEEIQRVNPGWKADETVVSLVFLSRMPADEIARLLLQLTGESSIVIPYAPANLLVISTPTPAIR